MQHHDLFGYVGPAVRPRKIISVPPTEPDVDPELEVMLASLDNLLEECPLGPEAEATVSSAESARATTSVPRDEEDESPDQNSDTPATDGDLLPHGEVCPRPYLSFQADLRSRKLESQMNRLSGNSRWLVPEPTSWISLGTGSASSSRSINTKKIEDIKINWTIRSRFPTRFSSQPTELTSIRVNPGMPSGLPRWKDKGKVERASRSANETLLGIRIASVVAGGAPTMGDLSELTTSPQVGFFSLRLPPHLHHVFCNLADACDLISRTLMRRLRTRAERATGVFAWRREDDGGMTLFGALSRAGDGGTGDYVEARAGKRFGRSLARAGIEEENFYDIHPQTFADLYGLPHSSFKKGWADHHRLAFIEKHPEAADPIEFDFHAKRFRTQQEIDARNCRNAAIWNDYATRCGLPTWYGNDFLEVFVDVVVRTPQDARRHRHAEETAKKWMESRNKKEAAKLVMAEIERADATTLETLRFYRGSPAEFAALATAEGQLLGIYCPTELMKVGEGLYDQLRQVSKLP